MTQAKVQHVLYRARPLEVSAEACAVDVGRRLGDDGPERASLRIRERYAPLAGAAPDRCHAHAWLCAGA
jgi:hypothetical protein